MKQNYTLSKEGLMVINGELAPVHFAGIKVMTDGHIVYETKEYGLLVDIVTYVDRQSFEQGIMSERKVSVKGYVTDDGKMSLYRMKNGEPVEVFEEVDLVYKNGYLWPILKEGLYPSRQECLRNNTYIEVMENGSKVEHTGILKKIKLTDKQRKFIDEVLAPAFEKARELMIGFVIDYNEELKAFNKGAFKSVMYDYYNSIEEAASATLDDMGEAVTSCISVISDESVIYDEE